MDNQLIRGFADMSTLGVPNELKGGIQARGCLRCHHGWTGRKFKWSARRRQSNQIAIGIIAGNDKVDRGASDDTSIADGSDLRYVIVTRVDQDLHVADH